jgi:hypothetical protein
VRRCNTFRRRKRARGGRHPGHQLAAALGMCGSELAHAGGVCAAAATVAIAAATTVAVFFDTTLNEIPSLAAVLGPLSRRLKSAKLPP